MLTASLHQGGFPFPGEMGQRIASLSWIETDCGAPEHWPAALVSNIQTILSSQFPMFVVWGPGRTLIYNDAYIRILGPKHPEALGRPFFDVWPEVRPAVEPIIDAAFQGQGSYFEDLEVRLVRGGDEEAAWFTFSYGPVLNPDGAIPGALCVCMETTKSVLAERAATEQANSLAILNATGAALAGELDLQKVVQLVTDAGVDITGAQFGAFFYNLINDAGESYMLYTLSGVDRSHFDKFPMPRNTAVFAPTFRGEGVVRSDDITQDPRYGQNAPRRGMPEGHLPVRSYLAVPVMSRSGEVLGGLFFGHSEPGVFTANAEQLVRGVAGQAAVAIDNARLYQSAQRELEQRRRAEAQQLLLINELNHRVKNTLATVQSIVAQTSKGSDSPSVIRQAIEGRLLALSEAHDLLTQQNWEGADLLDVVDRATAAFSSGADGRIQSTGPSVRLSTSQALAISMALHELATNAVKYGALSLASGHVEIAWKHDAEQLQLLWREHDGPPVTPPRSRGFGSRLLERGLAADLQGHVKLAFHPAGLSCEILAPLGSPQQPAVFGLTTAES